MLLSRDQYGVDMCGDELFLKTMGSPFRLI
jgi:hypothetical protein